MLQNFLEKNPGKNISAIVEFPQINKRMICKDRLTLCPADTLTQESLKISQVVSTSKEKAYFPFWNQLAKEIASNLPLPIKTDCAGLDLTSLNSLLRDPVERSWFSTEQSYLQNQNSLKICFPSSMFSHAECTDLEVTKTKLLRISPTKRQTQIFKSWTDCSRFVFNQTISYIRSCVGWTPSWMDIKKDMKQFLPEWCKKVPFQIKGIAVKEACNAFWKAKGSPSFRTRKNPEQSCFLPKTAISKKGIYLRISGKGLFFQEALPEKPKDSRLIWRYEKWWLSIPHKAETKRSENQARIVALDPGVRNFLAFYAPNTVGFLGKGDFSRIQRLCFHMDNLISKRGLSKNKQKRKAYTKALNRMRGKIKFLIDELHHKCSKFLLDNFDIILLPTFETKQMANKKNRKIRAKSVRQMLTFSHYKFKCFLKWKAEQAGKIVVDVNEAYTSKTHPETGKIKNIGGAKTIKLLDGSRAERDFIGARNILIKWLSEYFFLVDTPMPLLACS